MRKLIYSMTVSLDGYIAGPDGAIDWTVPDEELFRFHMQHVQEIGVQLCGRRLYEAMVYWETAEESPLAADDVEFAQTLEGPAEGRVLHDACERRRQQQAGQGRCRRGDLEAQGRARKGHRRRRRRPRPCVYELELIDEWRLFVSPVVLGGGTPYFPGLDERINLELVETQTFGSRCRLPALQTRAG